MSPPTFGYVDGSVDPLLAVECGLLAEKNGFDILWLPDHIVDVDGDKLEPWTILSAVAAKTKRIRLASSVTDTQRSHPSRTAHAVACLDVLSKGRAVLGIGAGEAMNITPFGLPWDSPRDRVIRLDEAVQVIRLLWGSSRKRPVDFAGSFFSLKQAFLSQTPYSKPNPPIFIGAFASPRALRVAGKRGDGWHSWINTPDTFRKRWAVVRESIKASGRSDRKFVTSSHLMIALPRNHEERKAALLAGKATLLMEKDVLVSMGYASEVAQYQHQMVLREDVAKVMDEAAKIPDDLVYRTMAIGGIGEIEEKVEELAKAGIKHLAIADLLAPKTAKRTLQICRRITRRSR
jgi:phthiodiolone/phenolphthiodiolone dimycocerosates ketoreductase